MTWFFWALSYNNTLRHLTDILTGRSTDIDKLTHNIELSSLQHKDKQISDLQLAWDNVAFPTHGLSHMVKLHTDYLCELTEQENKRIQDVLYYVLETKRTSPNPQDITAQSIGVSSSRRPTKCLPQPSVTDQNGAHFGINPDSGERRPSPLLYPHPVTNLTTMADILVFLLGTKQLDLRLTILAVLQKGQLMGLSAKTSSFLNLKPNWEGKFCKSFIACRCWFGSPFEVAWWSHSLHGYFFPSCIAQWFWVRSPFEVAWWSHSCTGTSFLKSVLVFF